MAARYITIDRQSPMLMPPDIRDWLPENHIARFIFITGDTHSDHVKQAMGFRQFHLRGHPKVELEWNLVCLAYNFRRLFNISGGGSLLQNGLNSAKNT